MPTTGALAPTSSPVLSVFKNIKYTYVKHVDTMTSLQAINIYYYGYTTFNKYTIIYTIPHVDSDTCTSVVIGRHDDEGHSRI